MKMSATHLLSLGSTNTGNPVLWYGYQWDNGGNIRSITNNGTEVASYGYDLAGQLTNEVSGGVVNSWAYDEAGNWLGGDGKWRGYNADNEMLGTATNTVTVRGTVDASPGSNKWYSTWASCRGVTARVSTNDGTFSLPNVPLHPGSNALLVTVTDVSGNTSKTNWGVFKTTTNVVETFAYDGNGNLANWLNGSITNGYQWDWADRLVKVTSNNVIVLENWYDANGRRIAKKEVAGGQTNAVLYVWDGLASAAVLSESAQFLESYTRGVSLAGDIGTLVAITHHAGANAGTYYTHHNHRGDVMLTRSGTTTVGSYDYSAFGVLTSAVGPDVCRFKFSSKEPDTATGLSYYGYRFYGPLWQRWLSRDPIGERGGLNLYTQAGNNCVNRIDPLGLDPSAELCFIGCLAKLQQDQIAATARITYNNAPSLGVGVGMAGLDLAIAPAVFTSGGTVIIVWIGYTAITAGIDYYAAVQVFNDKAIEKQIVDGAFAKCLNACRKQCPNNNDEAITFYNENKWK